MGSDRLLLAALQRATAAEIMNAAEDHRDKLTIILAGYKRDIEDKLFAFNSGMVSLILAPV